MKNFNKSLLAFALIIVVFGVFINANAITVGIEHSNAKGMFLVDDTGASINSSNPIPVDASGTPVASMVDGRKVVASAGTAEAVTAASEPFVDCDVQAEEDNTGDVVIGSSTVVANLATRRGTLLTPSSNYHFAKSNDLANIFIDVEISGDGVIFFCRK